MKDQIYTPKPFTGEMWSFLLVNAIRGLTKEQRTELCFDLYERSDREAIDIKIARLKEQEKNFRRVPVIFL